MTQRVEYDVAVVGGGISGMYSAWRLMTSPLDGQPAQWAASRGRLKVAVFEGSNRIGGRLLSAIAPGMPGTICEIGGMRYVSSQVLVRSLIENKLQLPRTEQVVYAPENVVYVRGKMLRFSDVTNPDLLPYTLEWAERQWIAQKPNGNDPSGLMGWAISRILPQVTTLQGDALQSYLEQATVDGLPLYEHGLWNLLARALSSEGYQLSKTLIGYDCLGNNANAVDLTKCYFDFTPDVKYYLLNGSYEAIPWTLQEEFENAGGALYLNQWVQSFDETTLGDGTKGVELQFNDGLAPVAARAIILALPKRSLELLAKRGPVLDPARAPAMQTMLDAVMPIGLYKMFIGYNSAWWESMGVSQGRSFTDMPLRQCYYWGKNAHPSHDRHGTNAMLMVYDDASSVDFWGGLRTGGPRHPVNMRGYAGGLTPFARKTTPEQDSAAATQASSTGIRFAERMRNNWNDHRAPALLVEETHRQLKLMHNAQYAPDPVEAAYADWNDDPYGGAVHMWNRGYKSWEMVEAMTQPVEGFPCYLCGEAYSTAQTWVEGALETAEIVLQKRLGMPAPEWLTAKQN